MLYQFSITATDSRLISSGIELEENMTIKDLKFKLVGPIIATIGFDKIKFFQKGGVEFSDDDTVSKFNKNSKILIFPLVHSIRSILINNFKNNSDSDSDSDNDVFVNNFNNKSSNDEDNEPLLESKSSEEIISEINETLTFFSKPAVNKLMKIYSENKKDFIDFITYLSEGNYSNKMPHTPLEYPTYIYDNIRKTFDNFKNKTNNEIKNELNNYGGNFDILIMSNFTKYD